MDKYPDLQTRAIHELYRVAQICRMCESPNLTEYLDLGFTPPADQFRTKEELILPEISYPLKVALCQNCGLSQLTHIVSPRVLYQYDYPYEQSTTKTGQKHWDDFAKSVVFDLGLVPGSFVVDIGSNVGTLLKSFRELGMKVHGVDPAPNIVKIAQEENSIETTCAFFDINSASTIRNKIESAAVIVGSNVFAHIDDLHEVMRAVRNLLRDDGVFIFESPYFQYLVDNLEYDTIYHEHLSYLSLKPLIPFFSKFDMEVFMVKETDIHGGSFRVFIGKKGLRPIDESVNKVIQQEENRKLHDIETMHEFAKRVLDHRNKLVQLIESLILDGKRVAAVSAPAKGMTLLNYCGFNTRQISFISEKARLKIGRYTPGGHIPIVSDDALLAEQPDYALILAWNFSKEIVTNLKPFTEKGGHFIIPIPEPHIV